MEDHPHGAAAPLETHSAGGRAPAEPSLGSSRNQCETRPLPSGSSWPSGAVPGSRVPGREAQVSPESARKGEAFSEEAAPAWSL